MTSAVLSVLWNATGGRGVAQEVKINGRAASVREIKFFIGYKQAPLVPSLIRGNKGGETIETVSIVGGLPLDDAVAGVRPSSGAATFMRKITRQALVVDNASFGEPSLSSYTVVNPRAFAACALLRRGTGALRLHDEVNRHNFGKKSAAVLHVAALNSSSEHSLIWATASEISFT